MSTALDALIGQAGNAATWAGGLAPVKPITDQSDHVDGGNLRSSAGTNSVAPDHAKRILWLASGIVLIALALLWMTGGIGLRSARL